MNIKNSKHSTPEKVTLKRNTKRLKALLRIEESDGFCICPKCFHLVFDEGLTGTCPNCHYHFCAACYIKKPSV